MASTGLWLGLQSSPKVGWLELVHTSTPDLQGPQGPPLSAEHNLTPYGTYRTNSTYGVGNLMENDTTHRK
jgi:hypothetical protein